MGLVKTDVSIAQKVTKETSAESSHVPGDGKTITVFIMGASIPDESDVVVQLVWDVDGTPEVLWSMQHGHDFPDKLEFTRTGDGVKKMAVCLTNDSTATDYHMAGWYKADVES